MTKRQTKHYLTKDWVTHWWTQVAPEG